MLPDDALPPQASRLAKARFQPGMSQVQTDEPETGIPRFIRHRQVLKSTDFQNWTNASTEMLADYRLSVSIVITRSAVTCSKFNCW